MARLWKNAGFTLIELIIVIVLLGILAGLLSNILVGPIRAYRDFKLRATVVDIAETALQRMGREIRFALPNSVRVTGGGTTVEFLNTITGGRYRAFPAAAGTGDFLDFALDADTFDILMGVIDPGDIDVGVDGNQAECLNGAADCLVIYNTGLTGFDAYDGDNIATIMAATATSLRFDNHADLPGWVFPASSPSQRFFVVDGPVSFVCDLAAGTIRRVSGYPIASAPNLAAGTSNLLVDHVSDCSFQYNAGTETRGGTLTMILEIRDTTFPDDPPGYRQPVSRLLQQVHVSNAP